MDNQSLFPLGQLVATQNALDALPMKEIEVALTRHSFGDWGELTDDDRAENDKAVTNGTRILSAYATGAGTRFWIITEWDRSATTILLPTDY
jgi:hypothetical protein